MKPFIATTAYLTAQLRPWLECFSSGTVYWGLITDIRDDGSAFKRHGVIVELVVKDPQRFLKQTRKLRGDKLREASISSSFGHLYDEADLQELFQPKTPIELQVRFDFSSEQEPHELAQQFGTYFLEELHDLSHWTCDELRHRLIALTHQNLRDIPGFGTSSFRRLRYVPVAVTLAIGHRLSPSFTFLKELTKLATALQSNREHYRDTSWAMYALHAPRAVHELQLSLKRVSITSEVVEQALALVATGIRVNCVLLSLDVSVVTCTDSHLAAFVQAITLASPSVCIDTHHWSHHGESVDEETSDCSGAIRTVFSTVASLEKPVTIDLSGMLWRCRAARHRSELFRGLFDAILSRTFPTSLTTAFYVWMEGDLSLISQFAYDWRQRHPGRLLSVASLNLCVEDIAMERAFLNALDDVEAVAVRFSTDSPASLDFVHSVLRFPSLRQLNLYSVSIPSMELFDPSVPDPLVPNKPILELLELEGLTLENPDSLRWFVTRLDPNATSPSPLSTSLHTLGITLDDGSVEELSEDEDYPHANERLAVEDRAVVDAVHEVFRTNHTLRDVNFVGNFTCPPASLAKSHAGKRKSGYLMRASREERRSAIAKARNAAFLSVVEAAFNGGISAMSRFDARIEQKILALSAPHVYGTLKLQPQ